MPHEVSSRLEPLRSERTELVEFDLAPFPYAGRSPSGKPFLDVTDEDGRRGRTWRGRVLWEDVSFSDNRALVHIPKGFDARRPGLIVVFLHGHRATLERDVRDRQKVADQIAEGNIAVLIAPQFAVNASDSSAGRFWESYGFARFLGEAGAPWRACTATCARARPSPLCRWWWWPTAAAMCRPPGRCTRAAPTSACSAC